MCDIICFLINLENFLINKISTFEETMSVSKLLIGALK